MKLDTRVSIFFLSALAVALGGFSGVLYATLRHHLQTEFDDRLKGALQILTASIEVEPEDVTWYPEEYTLDFRSKALQYARWVVAEENGRIVDQSPNLAVESTHDQFVIEYGRTSHPRHSGTFHQDGWRIVQSKLSARHPQAIELREFNEYASLVVTVAMPDRELVSSLEWLAYLLVALPLVFWLVAAALGRTYVRRSLQPLRAMADQAASAVGAAFDLRLPSPEAHDELAELSSAFNRLLDKQQQAYERERRFSSNAAHQLRTPLTILQGEIEVTLRKARSPAEYVGCLDKLTVVGDEMRQIVESLLFLARNDELANEPQRESLDLAEWLPSYAARWNTHPRASDLDIKLPGSLCVLASRALLMQILDNLVQNAFLYSSPDTPVLLEAVACGEHVELRVQDRGMGIQASDVDRIFDPFFRSSKPAELSKSGAGLGLAVAQRLAPPPARPYRVSAPAKPRQLVRPRVGKWR